MLKRQQGQTIVEFALVIPIFLLILMGIMSFAMYFSDYIALNNIARSVAREASLLTNKADDNELWSAIPTRYVKDVPSDSDPTTYYLPNSAYTWDPSTMTITAVGADKTDVKVSIRAYVSGSGPVRALANLMGDSSFLNSIEIDYTMYWEKKPTTTAKK